MKTPRVTKTAFYNNPFIGLFLKASDKLALAPKNSPHKLLLQAEETLGVPCEKIFVDNSHLVGTMIAMNSHGAVVSQSAQHEEISFLKKQGLNVFKLGKFSPGNTILCNDKAAIVNERIDHHSVAKIGECLGVPAIQHRLAGMGALATTSVVTNRGLLAYNELTDTEIKFLEKTFGVRGNVGTSNLGVPFNSLGVAANSHGALVGMQTTGFETQRIFEALFGD